MSFFFLSGVPLARGTKMVSMWGGSLFLAQVHVFEGPPFKRVAVNHIFQCFVRSSPRARHQDGAHVGGLLFSDHRFTVP